MNDLLRFAINQAIQDHGSRIGEFTARRFWLVFARLAQVEPIWDDKAERMVTTMLTGRQDVQVLRDGEYRLTL